MSNKQIQIVTSARSFKSLVRSLQERDIKTAYVRLEDPKRLVFSERSVKSQPRLVRVDLPEPSRANDWWFNVWEGQIVEYRFFDDDVTSIACQAKSAIWAALPELFLPISKERFSEVSDDQFEELVGAKTYDEMLTEYVLMGLAIRRIKRMSEETKRILTCLK